MEMEDTLLNNIMNIDLPFVDGVDWQCAMLKLRNEKILKDAIDGLVMTADSDIKVLKSMYETVLSEESEEAFGSFRIKAHSMKSNVATIGAYHVAGLAKYLEYAARDKDLTVITSLLPLFEREWLTLKNTIASELHMDSNNDNLSKITKEVLFELLLLLESAMSEYDIEQADATIEKLANYSYENEELELFNQIKLHVTNLDVEDCNDEIAKWRQLYTA